MTRRSSRAATPAQPAAIAERGEHELDLAGVTYRLRPSHAALKAVEQKTGRSTLELIRLGNAGGLSYEQLGLVAAEFIRAGAAADDPLTRAVSAERIEELVFEEGLGKPMAALTLCLLDAATGGRDAAGNVKPAAA